MYSTNIDLDASLSQEKKPKAWTTKQVALIGLLAVFLTGCIFYSATIYQNSQVEAVNQIRTLQNKAIADKFYASWLQRTNNGQNLGDDVEAATSHGYVLWRNMDVSHGDYYIYTAGYTHAQFVSLCYNWIAGNPERYCNCQILSNSGCGYIGLKQGANTNYPGTLATSHGFMLMHYAESV